MAGEIYTTAAVVLSVMLTNAYLNARRAKKNAAQRYRDPVQKMMNKQDMQAEIDYLYAHPKHDFWNLDTLSCLDAEYTVHGDAYTLLDLTFFQWHFYYERNKLDPSFPSYLLTNIAQYPGNEFELLYPEDALYQFIMGWMMAASPGFFLLNPDYFVGKGMMMKAHQLEPDNPLYKWAVSDQLNFTREETRALAVQVNESQFDDLEPFIKDYFMELLQGDV